MTLDVQTITSIGTDQHLPFQILHHVYLYFRPGHEPIQQISATVQRNIGRLVQESLDVVRVPWLFVVSELDPRVCIAPPGAMVVEAADGPRQARVPPVALRHRLRDTVDALGVCECLVVDDLAGFRNAQNSNLSAYIRHKHVHEQEEN